MLACVQHTDAAGGVAPPAALQQRVPAVVAAVRELAPALHLRGA